MTDNGAKVKLFRCEWEIDTSPDRNNPDKQDMYKNFEKEINDFMSRPEVEVIDIKYQSNISIGGLDMQPCKVTANESSALVIYKIETLPF